MASKTVNPIKGFTSQLELPGDKSISHRAAILGMLAKGETTISRFLTAEDCLNTLKACEQLGAKVSRQGTEVAIRGCGLEGLVKPDDIIDCGNSGTGVRLLSGVLAGQPFESTITGDEQIQRRPMRRIIEPLSQMGASISSEPGGLCPLKIKGGRLTPVHYISPIASAQVKSCILLAGLYAGKPTTVTEPSLSRDHTERMLNHFGVKVKTATVPNVPMKLFSTSLPVQITLVNEGELTGRAVNVPADISSAAFFMVAAAALPGTAIKIKNIGINPTRTGIIDALRLMGAEVNKVDQRNQAGERVADLVIKGKEQMEGVDLCGAIIPRMIDELPIIAVAAAMAKGRTVISDAAELRVKETDRISTVVDALKKIGVHAEEKQDGMIIEGGTIRGGTVDAHGDHRLAMSMAIAGLVSKEGVTINNSECVNTSFPEFWDKLEVIINESEK